MRMIAWAAGSPSALRVEVLVDRLVQMDSLPVLLVVPGAVGW